MEEGIFAGHPSLALPPSTLPRLPLPHLPFPCLPSNPLACAPLLSVVMGFLSPYLFSALLRFAYIGEKVLFTQEVVVTIGRRVEFGEFGRITICANNEYSYDLNTNVN